MQQDPGPPVQQHARQIMLSPRRTLCHRPCHIQRSSHATQSVARAAQPMRGSLRTPLSSRAWLCHSDRHGNAHVHLGGDSSWQQVQPSTARGRQRSRRRGSCTVAKAKPPRMRGQACDLGERPRSTALPAVDWRRYHLNVLFVDRSGAVRDVAVLLRMGKMVHGWKWYRATHSGRVRHDRYGCSWRSHLSIFPSPDC
jgi:hypothetical protein